MTGTKEVKRLLGARQDRNRIGKRQKRHLAAPLSNLAQQARCEDGSRNRSTVPTTLYLRRNARMILPFRLYRALLAVFCCCVLSWLGIASAANNTSPSQFFESIIGDERTPYESFLASQDYDKNIFLPTTADPSEGMAVFWKIHNLQNFDSAVVVSRRDSNPYGAVSYTHLTLPTKA